MSKIGLGYSSLTDRVFIGKQKNLGNGVGVFTGDKTDCTNQFLHIVDQYFEKGTSRIINCGEESSLYIHIDNTKEAKEKLIKSLQKDIESNP